MPSRVSIDAEPLGFSPIPTGWRAVAVCWFDDPEKPFIVEELPAIGVAVVNELQYNIDDIADRGREVGRHLDFVIVTGDGLVFWQDYAEASNVEAVGFLSPGASRDTFTPEHIADCVDHARKKWERSRKPKPL